MTSRSSSFEPSQETRSAWKAVILVRLLSVVAVMIVAMISARRFAFGVPLGLTLMFAVSAVVAVFFVCQEAKRRHNAKAGTLFIARAAVSVDDLSRVGAARISASGKSVNPTGIITVTPGCISWIPDGYSHRRFSADHFELTSANVLGVEIGKFAAKAMCKIALDSGDYMTVETMGAERLRQALTDAGFPPARGGSD